MKPETKRLVDAAMASAHRDGVAAARGNAYMLRSPARRELDEHLERLEARAATAAVFETALRDIRSYLGAAGQDIQHEWIASVIAAALAARRSPPGDAA